MHMLEITLHEANAGMIKKWEGDIEIMHEFEEQYKLECESRLMKLSE